MFYYRCYYSLLGYYFLLFSFESITIINYFGHRFVSAIDSNNNENTKNINNHHNNRVNTVNSNNNHINPSIKRDVVDNNQNSIRKNIIIQGFGLMHDYNNSCLLSQ